MLSLKVLNEQMESCNNGLQKWQIGKKITVKGKLQMCAVGLHLTTFPEDWNGTRVFIAEATKPVEKDERKTVHRTVKLLKELSPSELQAYYEARAPARKAYDEAVAPARKAYDEARAPAEKAYDEARATARKAYDEARATARKDDEAIQQILQKLLKGEK